MHSRLVSLHCLERVGFFSLFHASKRAREQASVGAPDWDVWDWIGLDKAGWLIGRQAELDFEVYEYSSGK
jgi:hypothetical protein